MGSFSGEFFEDLIIDSLLSAKKTGLYVDIGANDPNFTGHTKRFYLRGWSGINVEPQKHLFNELNKHRKSDINLNVAVGSKKGLATFYELPNRNDGSSLNKKMADLNSKWHKAEIKEVKKEVVPLKEIFENHLSGRKIDFMSVDVEGTEMDVLKSNDWNNFRPPLVMVEIAHFDCNEIIRFMEETNYSLIYNNIINGIFLDEKSELYSNLINTFNQTQTY